MDAAEQPTSFKPSEKTLARLNQLDAAGRAVMRECNALIKESYAEGMSWSGTEAFILHDLSINLDRLASLLRRQHDQCLK